MTILRFSSFGRLLKWCRPNGALSRVTYWSISYWSMHLKPLFRTHESECTDTCNRLHTEYEDYIHNQTQFNPKYSNEWEACNCDVSLLLSIPDTCATFYLLLISDCKY